MLHRFLIAIIALLLLTSFADAAGLRAIPGTGLFTDGSKTYLFHGLNMVNKAAEEEKINTGNIQFLQNFGFNAVRLGFLWYNVEIAPGVYNETYLAKLKSDVDKLWAGGIRVFLDLHQDCFSEYFCTNEDGVPDFVGHPPNTTEYYANQSMAFPLPIAAPKYDNPIPGLPWGKISNCGDVASGPFGWASCYTTFAAGAAVQRLYDNDGGALDHLGAMWQKVASMFKDHPGVIAYELMNEPWLGNVPLRIQDFVPPYKYWDLWFPGVADKTNLAPFYNTLNAAIRAVDNNTILFFEPASGGNILDTFNVGFPSGPGGATYDSAGLNVLSYHVYCPWIESDMPYNINTTNWFWNWLLDQLEVAGCDLLNGFQYDNRKNDVARLGVGGWLSEFGAIPDDVDGQRVIDFAMMKMDSFLHSWTYWYIDATVNSSIYQRNSISRPFPHETWGTPTRLQFDNTTKEFAFWYTTPTKISSAVDNSTRIFVPPVQYPNGVLFWTSPGTTATLTTSNFLVVTHSAALSPGSAVNVTMIAAPERKKR